MVKISKKFLAIFFVVWMMVFAAVPAYAAEAQEELSPRYAVPIDVSLDVNISSSLMLYTTAEYATYDPAVTRVVMTTYVEKRSLLVIWNRVDIGQTNNEWVDVGGMGTFDATHTVQLSNSGKYRVTTVYEVYNGSTLLDTIEETVSTDC